MHLVRGALQVTEIHQTTHAISWTMSAQIDAGPASWVADVVVTTTVVVVVVASIDLRECSDLWTRVRDGPVRGGPEGGCSLVSEEVVLRFLLLDMCPMLRRSRQTRATLRSAPPSTAIEQGGPGGPDVGDASEGHRSSSLSSRSTHRWTYSLQLGGCTHNRKGIGTR